MPDVTVPRAGCCHANAPAARASSNAPVQGRFSLIDHHGRPVTQHSWPDRHLLVFFGFTHCAAVCPRELGKLRQVLDRLGYLAERIQVLYVTVDPERDRPEVMRRYLAGIDARFIGLTGSPDQVTEAMSSFRVFAEKRDDPRAPGGYVMPHTAFTFLMAPDGRYLAHFPDVLDADAVAARVSARLAARSIEAATEASVPR